MQKSVLVRTKDSSIVWKSLNGIINVYKPAGITVNHVKKSILGNLCKGITFSLPMKRSINASGFQFVSGLNSLDTRPPRDRIVISEAPNDRYKVNVTTDWSDHVLAVGARHQISDFSFTSTHLPPLTSGVLCMSCWGNFVLIRKP